jgi:hypothetical protein
MYFYAANGLRRAELWVWEIVIQHEGREFHADGRRIVSKPTSLDE